MVSVLRFGSLMLTCGLLLACTGAAERQEEYLQRADAFFSAGELDKARVEVRNALQIDGNHAQARFLYARLLEREKNWNQVYANLKFAVELDPALIPARIMLGELLLANQFYDEAIDQADRVFEFDLANVHALALKAAVHRQLGETEEAIAFAQEALSNDPSHVGSIGVLTEIYKQNNPELALSAIQQGIARQDKSAALLLLKATVHEAQHQQTQAERVYQELTAAYPDNLYYFYRYVLLLNRHGRSHEAENLLRRIVRARPENDQLKLWLAQFMVDRNDLEAAEQALLDFLAEEPEQSGLQFALAQIYILQQKQDQARAVYAGFVEREVDSQNAQRARNALVRMALATGDRVQADGFMAQIFDIEPNNVQALTNRARIALAEGRIEEGIIDLRLALKNRPDFVDALLLLARAQEANDAPDLAIDRYREVLLIEPTNQTAVLALTEHALRRDELDSAATLAGIAMRLDPANSEAARLLVTTLVRQQRFDDATELARQLVERRSTKVLGTYLLGRVYQAQEQLTEAMQKMRETIALEPRVIEALRALVEMTGQTGSSAQAIGVLRAHLMAHPDHLHALELLGQYQADSGDLAGAAAQFKQVIEQNPRQMSAYMLLGDVALLQEQYSSARQAYADGLSQNRRNVPLLLRMAQLEERQQNFASAVKLYETALTLSGVVVAQNNLAMIYAQHLKTPGNLNKALGLMRQHANSDNPALLDTLGWVYFQLGEYRSALRYLKAAVEAGGERIPTLQYHLGRAYLESEQPQQAERAFEAALSSKEPFAERESAVQQLGIAREALSV